MDRHGRCENGPQTPVSGGLADRHGQSGWADSNCRPLDPQSQGATHGNARGMGDCGRLVNGRATRAQQFVVARKGDDGPRFVTAGGMATRYGRRAAQFTARGPAAAAAAQINFDDDTAAWSAMPLEEAVR